MQNGKQSFNPLCSQQTNTKGIQWLQRAEGLNRSAREFSGGILVEMGLHRGQEHSWCNAVDVSTSCVQCRILICISSWAHRAWHLACAFVTAAGAGLPASVISPVPGKPTHEPISRALIALLNTWFPDWFSLHRLIHLTNYPLHGAGLFWMQKFDHCNLFCSLKFQSHWMAMNRKSLNSNWAVNRGSLSDWPGMWGCLFWKSEAVAPEIHLLQRSQAGGSPCPVPQQALLAGTFLSNIQVNYWEIFFSGKNEAKPLTPRKKKWISLSRSGLEKEIYISTLSVQHSSTGIATVV